jgi:hypothetical protein
MASGIFNAFLGIGQCLGPLYGATTTKRLGFQTTTDILALYSLAFAALYFFSAGGLGALRPKAP